MSDIVLVAGNTAPSISGVITDINGAVVPLTGATVKFQMRLLYERRFAVDATAVIVNATTGSVRYDWAAADLANAGEYQSQWQTTNSGGTIQTTTPANTITVRSD